MQLQAWVSKSAAMTLSGCAHLQLYFPACRGLCGVSVIDAGRPRLPCLTQSLQLNSWHGGAAAQCDHVHSLQHSIPLQRCTGLQQLQPTSLGAPGRPVPARRPAWTCAPSCPARTLMLSFTTPRLACKSALWQRLRAMHAATAQSTVPEMAARNTIQPHHAMLQHMAKNNIVR